MPEIGGTLVLAPNWLGDAVMSLPAVAAIKRRVPAMRVTVAARPSVASLFELAPYVDDVVSLEWRGRWFRLAGLRADVDRLRQVGASAAILMPNSFASAWLARQAGIADRGGYAADLRSPLLSRAVPKPKGSLHQAEYYRRLVQGLGIPTGAVERLLEVPDDDIAAARMLLAARGWTGQRPLVALAPGAAYGTAKRWLPSHFAALASSLAGESGAVLVLVGSAADAPTAQMVRDALPAVSRPVVIDLTGATSLRVLAAVLATADACVSNDSGAMHLAAAVGTALVALFGPTNEHETSPLQAGGGRARVLFDPVSCRPCMLRECPIDHRCMTRLTPDRVFVAVTDVMTDARGGDAP